MNEVSFLIDNEKNGSHFFDNVEVLAVVSTQKLNMMNFDEKPAISYPEASELIKDILAFALASTSTVEGLETASEVFLAAVFSKILYKFSNNISSKMNKIKIVGLIGMNS